MKFLLLNIVFIVVLKSSGFSQLASQKPNRIDELHVKVRAIQKYVVYINSIKLLKIGGNDSKMSKAGNISYREYCIDPLQKDVVKRVNKRKNGRHSEIWVNYYKNNQIVCSKTVLGKRNKYFLIEEKYYEKKKMITIITKETHQIDL